MSTTDWYGYATAASASGSKTLTALKTICQYSGWNDMTTTGTAELTNFINDTIQILAMLKPWPEYMHLDGTIVLPARTATITSIVGDGTTVTVTTSAAHYMSIGNIVTISGTTNYNETSDTIVSVPSSTTFTYTCSDTGAEETSGTVTMDVVSKPLAGTRLLRLGTVVRSDKSSPLDEITVDDWLFNKRHHAATGPPNEYALRKYVSTGDIKAEILPYPEPTSSTTIYYTWQQSPVLLAESTDVTDWPDIRMWLLSAAMKKRLAAIDRDTNGVVLYSAEFMDLVERAFSQSRPSYRPVRAKTTIMSHRWRLQDIEKTFA